MNVRKKVRYAITKILTDKQHISLQYRYITGRKLNLKTPTRFNEKLQWIKLYDRKPIYTDFVDKIKVKAYISQKIGNEYIVPTLGIWSDPLEIDFMSLPEKFVLKCNHDSRSIIICKDKSKCNFDDIVKRLNLSLKMNLFYYGREWPYKNVVPMVLAEEYLEDESGGLQDYKVFCFNGVPKLVEMHIGRFTDRHTQSFYDTDWNLQPFNQIGETTVSQPVSRPIFLEKMLELSGVLAAGISHIRVDWYYANNQLYFGELTFFDGSGYQDFEPDEYNVILGSWIHLPIEDYK